MPGTVTAKLVLARATKRSATVTRTRTPCEFAALSKTKSGGAPFHSTKSEHVDHVGNFPLLVVPAGDEHCVCNGRDRPGNVRGGTVQLLP